MPGKGGAGTPLPAGRSSAGEISLRNFAPAGRGLPALPREIEALHRGIIFSCFCNGPATAGRLEWLESFIGKITAMNKNLVLIATMLALSWSWAGCDKAGKLDKISTYTPPAGAVELKLKWPKGERIVESMDMKQTLELSLPGQPAPITQDVNMGQEYGLTVLRENPDGGHEVELDVLSARFGMTMGGKPNLDYDSTKKATAGKADPAADMFGKIVGSKIKYFLNASNEVERMEGIDELLNRLASSATPESLASLKGSFGEAYFKQLMSHNQYMPPKAVQQGDTWPVQLEYPSDSVGTLVMDFTFTFQGWEIRGKRNCARLDFQGSIKTKPGSNAKKIGGVSISIQGGDSTGTSWFDPELGITIESTMSQDMQLVINLPVNPRGNKGTAGEMQSTTNEMKQDMTIKLISVK
jgi:hypothetical protein